MKTLLSLLFLLPVLVSAQPSSRAESMSRALSGYYYGSLSEPSGCEWQSVDTLAFNKLQPHAWFFSFASEEEALGVLPETSSYWQTLNGDWLFHWAPEPGQRVAGFWRDDSDLSAWNRVTVPMNWNIAGIGPHGEQHYGTPVYSNQRVIFRHRVRLDDWRGGVMRPAPDDWTTARHPNEVGQYRRTFTLPEAWKGRQVVMNFDGVDSFFYLYINGRYVGLSTNSRSLATFDITRFLRPGENTVAVEVMRSSMGSMLESQDMFRLPGIFRDVYLTSKPRDAQVYDVAVEPQLDSSYTQGKLHIATMIKSTRAIDGYSLRYRLYEVPLYQDRAQGEAVATVAARFRKDNTPWCANSSATMTDLTLDAGTVKPWSAERPQRYTLVGQLNDSKGRTVETFSTMVGFRKIEIRQTKAEDDEFQQAGRYYYLNGKPIKMRGVNRHETNAMEGHAITRQTMEREVRLMKQANINHVRCSHYPDAPYWYWLADKYGLYLEDEANIESHQYYYGKASLSHPTEWRGAHVARVMEMVRAQINHPSICIWSLGNEAGPGDNFKAAYQALKAMDDSRPVQYERNNDIVDIGSNQYPSIPWVRKAATGKADIKYPFHISEYGHSMGNAVGNLADYWQAIESTNHLIGGAVWEWTDHGQYNYTADGQRYIAYGGDFGDKPNDGMFCMDGVMMADLTPKAQYFEIKKVYQPIAVTMADSTKGLVDVFNKNYFEPLTGYEAVWSLLKDGAQQGGEQPLAGVDGLMPRQHKLVQLPIDLTTLDKESEYFVKLQWRQATDTPWAGKGFVQMEEQLLLRHPLTPPASPDMLATAKRRGKIRSKAVGDSIVVTGEGFSLCFDATTGSISRLNYQGRDMFMPDGGPQLDAFRAPTDNDAGAEYHKDWFRQGLYMLRHRASLHHVTKRRNGTLEIAFTIESQGRMGSQPTYDNRDRKADGHYRFDEHPLPPDSIGVGFSQQMVYTVYADGTIAVESDVNVQTSDSSLAKSFVLPRLGYTARLPRSMSQFGYYGRGPLDNYADRKQSQPIEIHWQSVAAMGTLLSNPQTMGNREDVRWCSLIDSLGHGVKFIAADNSARGMPVMSASALPWSEQQITLAAHPHELPKPDATWLHLNIKETGLGGASCGQDVPLLPDRTLTGRYSFSFIIQPI